MAPVFYRLQRGWLVALIAISAVCHVLPRHDDWGLFYFVFSRLNALRYLWCWLLGFLLWRDRGRFVVALAAACTPLILAWPTRSPLCIVTYVVSLGLVLAAPHLRLPRRSAAVLDYFGDLSYPLYLFHLPTFIFVYGWLGERRPLVLTAFALPVTALAHEAIDRRFKRAILVPILFPAKPSQVPLPVAAVVAAPPPGRAGSSR